MKTRNIVIGVVVAIIILAFLVPAINPLPPRKFTISTGSDSGAYYGFGLEYQEIIAKEALNLEVMQSAGSVENVERLRNGEVDIAIVQGGILDVKEEEDLLSLGSLYYEPIWVFYNDALNIRRLTELRGTRIGIGADGSGTQPVALQLLDVNGVTEDNATFVEDSLGNMADMLIDGELDAVFMVVSPSSEAVQKLAKIDDVDIFDFNRADAYRSRFTYLNSIELGQGALDLVQNVPDRSKTLLAVTANLVVHKDINPNLARLLIFTADRVHNGPGVFEDPGEFPSSAYITAPLHDESRRYFKEGASFFENNFPFMVAAIFDRLVVILLPLLTLVYPIGKSLFPLYRISMNRRITRWYNIISEIDRAVHVMTLEDITRELKRVAEIDEELREKTKLPESYMARFYNLREHLELVRSHLIERRDELQAKQDAQTPARAHT